MHGRIAPDSDDELRAQVVAWLRANLPAAWVAAIEHDDKPALRRAREQLDTRDWWERLGDAGWYFSNWPVEHGGLGLDPMRATVVNRVLSEYKVPRTDNPLGINVAHALMQWGTEEQRQRHLPAILHQREIWVQLFSEPGAGSDLASLATRAVRDGDTWIITGQKVWSSHAERAQWGILLARTDPDVPKHRGISVFLLDMTRPGIEVRPLRQMTGEAFFNEVFLDQVECPDRQRLGALGGGWDIASRLLTFERGAGSGSGSSKPSMGIGRSVESLRVHYAPVVDPILRARLAHAYVRDRVFELTRLRADAERKAGRDAARVSIILKLMRTEAAQALQTLAFDLEGMRGVAAEHDDRWTATSVYGFLRTRSATISGGSSEIQRNIIGEKVLGLPREPAVDRGVPWKDVRRS